MKQSNLFNQIILITSSNFWAYSNTTFRFVYNDMPSQSFKKKDGGYFMIL